MYLELGHGDADDENEDDNNFHRLTSSASRSNLSASIGQAASDCMLSSARACFAFIPMLYPVVGASEPFRLVQFAADWIESEWIRLDVYLPISKESERVRI